MNSFVTCWLKWNHDVHCINISIYLDLHIVLVNTHMLILSISVGSVCNVVSSIGGTVSSGSVHPERDTVAWQQIW